MALAISGLNYQAWEVDIKAKPAELLEISPKATVPVLVFADGTVMEQSMQIVKWALGHGNTSSYLPTDSQELQMSLDLIAQNDGDFKTALDRYKYPERHSRIEQTQLQIDATLFIKQWNAMLENRLYLLGDKPSMVDIALMPFVRQFASVDADYFSGLPFADIKAWLQRLIDTDIFRQVMQKSST